MGVQRMLDRSGGARPGRGEPTSSRKVESCPRLEVHAWSRDRAATGVEVCCVELLLRYGVSLFFDARGSLVIAFGSWVANPPGCVVVNLPSTGFGR